MACCGAEGASPTDRAITAQLKSDSKGFKMAMRLLILGTSASGKSTIAKQMKILHCNGFSPEEIANYKQILILNIFNGMKELIFQAEQLEIKIKYRNKKVSNYFSKINPYTESLTAETVEKAKQLWNDEGTLRFKLIYTIIFKSTFDRSLKKI